MSWFTDILSGGVDKIVDSVGAAMTEMSPPITKD